MIKIDGREVEKVGCNYCDSDSLRNLWVKDKFTYCQCKNCNLNFISPRLTQDEIKNIYEIGFNSKNLHKPPPLDYSLYSSFFRSINKYKQNIRLLDVGCFRGDLLNGARQKGWDVYGVEISEKAAKAGKKQYGIDIKIGSLQEAKFESNFFDAVSMLDVIEHLPDPKSYLKEIFRILRPGGVLYLDTPNFNSINRYIFKKNWSVFFPWHLYYFTPKTLTKLSKKCNFQVKKFITEDWGPISTNNVYKSLNKDNKISKDSGSRLIKLVFKFRGFLKPIYRVINKIANLPFYFMSYLGLHFGSKIIFMAEKPKS